MRGWMPSFWRFRRTVQLAVVADLGDTAQLWRLVVRKDHGHVAGPVADPRMALDPDEEFTSALTAAYTWAWAHEDFPRHARRGWMIRWCLHDADGDPASGPVFGGSLGAAFGLAIAHLFGLGRDARRRLDPHVVVSARLDDDGSLCSVQGLARKVPAAGEAGVRLVVARKDVDVARDARIGPRPDIDDGERIVDALRLVRAPRHWSLPAAVAAVVLVATSLTWATYQSGQNAAAARQQLLEQLTARSRQDLAADPAGAIFTAAAAASLAPDDTAARSALLSSTNVDSRLRHVFAGPVTAVAMSTDGKRLVTGGADDTVTEWSADQPHTPLRTGRHGGAAVAMIAVAPDGRTLVTGDQAGVVVRWDAAPTRATLVPHVLYEPGVTEGSHPVTAVAISPDGRFAAAASTLKSVRLFDLSGPGLPVEVYAQHPVTALAFSAATTLLIGCMDRSLTDQLLAVDVHAPQTLRTVLSTRKEPILQEGVTALAVSADGKTVVSGTMSADVIVWNAADLTKRTSFSAKDPVVGVATDGTNAVVTTAAGLGVGPFDRSVGDAHIQLWNLAHGSAVSAELAGSFLTATTAADAALGAVAVRDLDGSVTTWGDLAGQSLRQQGLVPDIVPDPRSAESVITVGLDGRIDFVNAETAQVTRHVDATGHGDVMALAASGSSLITAHSDGTILVRDRATGQPVGPPLTGHHGPVLRLAVTGNVLASGGNDGTVRLWDLNSHQQLRSWTADGKTITQVAFDATGRRLYVAEAIIQLAKVQGRMWWVSPDSDKIHGLREDETSARAVLPTGDRVLAGDGDGELHWLDQDLRSLPEQVPFRHRSNVEAVAAAGDLVVTAGADGVAAVLHAPDMTPMLQLPDLDTADKALYSSAITGDRRHAVVGSEDGRIQIVNLNTGDLTARGCDIVGRAATAADLGLTGQEEVTLPCR